MDFSDLPFDIIMDVSQIFLLEDNNKTINKIFNEHEDIYSNAFIW